MTATAIRDSLQKLESVLAENPEKGRTPNGSATAALVGGLKFRVSGPRGESAETDMPAAFGGAASAPNPGWLLRAALASCTATVIAMRAARSGVALDALDVTVESESDTRGLLGVDERVSAGLSGVRTRVRLAARGVAPERLREIAEWGDRHSPVACTLRDARPMALEVEVV